MTEETTTEQASPKVIRSSHSFLSSSTLGKLSEALAKAQGEIEGAKKDSSNPFFHSRYAALSSVWDACRGPLSKNGLAVIQLPGRNGEGLFVDSILSHSSGEWISGRLFVTPGKPNHQGEFLELKDAQAVGSAITYARRYGLQALVGIAPMDDDAEAAMGRQQTREKAGESVQKAEGASKSRKGKPSVPTVFNSGTDAEDKIPIMQPAFNGPHHEALATQLRLNRISEEDFMSAAKHAKMIPETAKSFRLMREETAVQFTTDPESVGVMIKSWRERPLKQEFI